MATEIVRSVSTDVKCGRKNQSIRDRVSGFLAGLTYGANGLGFEDSLDLLMDVPEETLVEWERGHFEEHGQRVVFGTPLLSVVDTRVDSLDAVDGFIRTMYFNARLDLEQSRVLMFKGDKSDSSEDVVFDFSQNPGPSSGLGALGIAVARRIGEHRRAHRLNESTHWQPNICILGGGGCILQAYLHDSLSSCTSVSVELSEEVINVARGYFGISRLEGDDFEIHHGCGIQFIQEDRAADSSIDVLVVDVEDGSSLVGEDAADWISPPTEFLSDRFLSSARRKLRDDGGVIVFNTIASDRSFDAMRGRIESAGFAHAHCDVPSTKRQRYLFCVDESFSAFLSSTSVREGLRSLPRMLDDEEAWLGTWTQGR